MLSTLAAFGSVAVDAGMPAGCVEVLGITGDVVRVKHDFRDTEGAWFYWAFRVRGAEGRRLKFVFPPEDCPAIGSRGAAVSCDRGGTWIWSDDFDRLSPRDELGEHADDRSFEWTFGADQQEVWFSQMIPYGEREWKAFLSRHEVSKGKVFEPGVLCRSRRGREVDYARFGRLDGRAPCRLFVTARHHCEEASASYVVEGMLEAFFGDDDLGRWLRGNLELRVVPFVDKDGVVDGDQGKNRRPWDHCRDYVDGRPQRYPEVAAIMKMLREWCPTAVQDTHSPWLRGHWTVKGNTNGFIYQVGNPSNTERMAEFGRAVASVATSGLGYAPEDDVAYGSYWNTGANYTTGKTLNAWAQENLRGCRLVTTWEIPFANQKAKTVYPKDLRAFGRDVIAGWRVFLSKQEGEANAAGDSGGPQSPSRPARGIESGR